MLSFQDWVDKSGLWSKMYDGTADSISALERAYRQYQNGERVPGSDLVLVNGQDQYVMPGYIQGQLGSAPYSQTNYYGQTSSSDYTYDPNYGWMQNSNAQNAGENWADQHNRTPGGLGGFLSSPGTLVAAIPFAVAGAQGLLGGAAAAGGTAAESVPAWATQAAQWPAGIAGAADPIEAIYQIDALGGPGALGFGSMDQALTAINPAWMAGAGGAAGAALAAGDPSYVGMPGDTNVDPSTLPTGTDSTGSYLYNTPGLGSIPGLGSLGNGLGNGSFPFSGFGDLAARLAPGYFALKYAQNQPGVDSSKLESLYSGFQPGGATDVSKLNDLYSKVGDITDPLTSASLKNFDIQTGLGRNALTSSLAQRGVMGSSFGNMDLGNFDTQAAAQRGMLEGNLGLQGAAQQTGIANTLAGISQADRAYGLSAFGARANVADQLLNTQLQQQAIKNALYGRAFDIFGRAVAPPTTFGMGSQNNGIGNDLASITSWLKSFGA